MTRLTDDDLRFLIEFERALESSPGGRLSSEEAGNRAGEREHAMARALRLASWGFLKKRSGQDSFRITYAGVQAVKASRSRRWLKWVTFVACCAAVASWTVTLLVLWRCRWG